MKKLEVGQKAPLFTLHNQNGKEVSLETLKDSWVVLYFYPKDFTPGCTVEACQFRDFNADLKNEGVVVFGVSADSVESHKKMVDKHNLSFDLLSDESKTTMKAYGAFGKKKMFGKEYDGIFRHTHIIDPKGKIAKIYRTVKPKEHAAQVLKDVQSLKNN